MDGSLLTWREGECLVFDDSYCHSVDYRVGPTSTMAAMTPTSFEAGALRVVLVVDLWHPDAARWFPVVARHRMSRAVGRH